VCTETIASKYENLARERSRPAVCWISKWFDQVQDVSGACGSWAAFRGLSVRSDLIHRDFSNMTVVCNLVYAKWDINPCVSLILYCSPWSWSSFKVSFPGQRKWLDFSVSLTLVWCSSVLLSSDDFCVQGLVSLCLQALGNGLFLEICWPCRLPRNGSHSQAGVKSGVGAQFYQVLYHSLSKLRWHCVRLHLRSADDNRELSRGCNEYAREKGLYLFWQAYHGDGRRNGWLEEHSGTDPIWRSISTLSQIVP